MLHVTSVLLRNNCLFLSDVFSECLLRPPLEITEKQPLAMSIFLFSERPHSNTMLSFRGRQWSAVTYPKATFSYEIQKQKRRPIDRRHREQENLLSSLALASKTRQANQTGTDQPSSTGNRHRVITPCEPVSTSLPDLNSPFTPTALYHEIITLFSPAVLLEWKKQTIKVVHSPDFNELTRYSCCHLDNVVEIGSVSRPQFMGAAE